MPAVPLRSHRSMPWANGQGISFEVARFPTEGDFDWRISLADVDHSGPFSVLPGIDRVLVLLSGQSIQLKSANSDSPGQRAPIIIRELEPFEFPGEVHYECTLEHGRAQDLNVMTRRGVCTSKLTVLHIGQHNIATQSGTQYIVCARGTVDIDGHTLDFRDAAQLHGDASIMVTGVAIHIRING